MKPDISWKVETVPGHLLERKLQQFTDNLFEVVNIEHTGARWTIIARTNEGKKSKSATIGFGK